MGTRATYEIQNLTYYIHWDGYPEGAAVYFYKMLALQNSKGGFREAFLRANDQASFTSCHEDHGDTEFRYTLNDKGELIAEARIGFTDAWEMIFCGDIADFVNQRIESVKRYTDDEVSQIVQFRGRYMTLDQLTDDLFATLHRARQQRYKGAVGNASCSYHEAWEQYLGMIEATDNRCEEIESEILETAKYFVDKYNWEMDNAVERYIIQFYQLPAKYRETA